MAKSLNMGRTLEYNEENLSNIPGCIGTYAFGTINNNDKFKVGYVGRAGVDNLNIEIPARWEVKKNEENEEGENKDYNFTHFKYRCIGELESYIMECIYYHRFKNLGFAEANLIHPDRPDNSPQNLTCPICEILES